MGTTTWGDVAAEYAEGLPFFAAVLLGAFVIFFILDVLDKGWRDAWKNTTEGASGPIALVLLVVALLILGGHLLGGRFAPAEDPYLVGRVIGYDGPVTELGVSLVANRTGDFESISFTLIGGSRISGDGTYAISLDDVAPGSYEVLLWGEDGLPLTVQPVELNWPLRGEIEGPDFVIKERGE